MFLALCMVLPLLTGQLKPIGKELCPMHLPVILCGFICGEWWGLAVGLVAPVLRSVIFGMPQFFPGAVAMSFELLTYGFVSGFLYRRLPKKVFCTYIALICAMLSGRVVWGTGR